MGINKIEIIIKIIRTPIQLMKRRQEANNSLNNRKLSRKVRNKIRRNMKSRAGSTT